MPECPALHVQEGVSSCAVRKVRTATYVLAESVIVRVLDLREVRLAEFQVHRRATAAMTILGPKQLPTTRSACPTPSREPIVESGVKSAVPFATLHIQAMAGSGVALLASGPNENERGKRKLARRDPWNLKGQSGDPRRRAPWQHYRLRRIGERRNRMEREVERGKRYESEHSKSAGNGKQDIHTL